MVRIRYPQPHFFDHIHMDNTIDHSPHMYVYTSVIIFCFLLHRELAQVWDTSSHQAPSQQEVPIS